MSYSPQTVTNKCRELEQRLEWPTGTVGWRRDEKSVGGFGVVISLSRDIEKTAMLEHLKRTWPADGMMIHFRQPPGWEVRIPAVQVDLDPPSES